jgi:hypothetical protein
MQGGEQALDRKDMTIGWEEIKPPFPIPAEISLRIEKRLKDGATFIDVSLYDPAKRDYVMVKPGIAIFAQAGGKNAKVVFFGRGWKGKDYSFFLDNVRIYDRKRS